MTANADRGLRAERAAEIIAGPADGGAGPGRRGSGYLVSPGRVLTAAHVVEGTETVRVRFEADRPGERTVDAAVEWRHAGVDVAVLTLLGDADADVPSVSFGRVGEQDAVLRCTALGFPRFKLRTDEDGSRFRDAEHMDATCAVLSNRREGTLDLKVACPPKDDPDPERDAWEGMSGAAVFSNGRLVGVVTRHHRTDGPGRLAASRVDRWAEALDVTDLADLEHVLGRGLVPGALPDALPATDLDLVQELYQAQLADIAPEELLGRQPEFNDLVAFCGGPDDYLWLQGPPWAGKTALAASFALNPPRGVVPVWFFITARYASQSDSNAYTKAVIDQLAAIAGREPTGISSPTARDGERRLLLRQAAERVAEDGGTLLLVVDGLDEDQSRTAGGSGTSIASLLPAKLPPNVRVLATSRPNPGLPPDVGGAHPLRHCRVVKLSPTAAARHTEYEARFDLEEALTGDKLQRDLVGLLTAARGTLTVEDLRELTGEPSYELNRRLGSAFGRILRLRGSGFESSYDRDVSLYMSSRGYLFAHETLLTAAQEALGPDVDAYLERLHAWATSYADRGWPATTPPYLLQPYGRLVAFLRDARRAVALATDVRRRDRLREITGSDAACLAEIEAVREVVRQVSPDDPGSLAALAVARDLVARRNELLHPDIPTVYARLGRVRHAIGLARSVFLPSERARAVVGVARVLAEAGDRRAVRLAEEAVHLAEGVVAREGRLPYADVPYLIEARGTLATALALTGRETEAVRCLRESAMPEDTSEAVALSTALVTAAAVVKDPADAGGLLRLAEECAETALPTDRVRILASVAEAWSAYGSPQDAARLHTLVVDLALHHAGSVANLPAVAAQTLRDLCPPEAELLTSLALAQWEQGARAVDGRTTYGAVHALVVTNRVADAHRLAVAAQKADRRYDIWLAVAEGWAREGQVAQAWAALEASRDSPTFSHGGGAARVVGLLVKAGAADDLEALLLSSADNSRRTVAEAMTTLAVHFAPSDPDRALHLLRRAEHGHHSAGGAGFFRRQDRIAALAGALATAGRPDEAERLVAAITDTGARAWGWAAVSLAVARAEPDRALRLAEQAISLSFTVDKLSADGPLMAAVQALGWAGATERVVEVLEKLSGEDGPLYTYEQDRVRTEAAAGLWPHDPDLAGRLVDEVLGAVRGRSVSRVAHLLVAVGLHDGERATRIQRILTRQSEHQPRGHSVLLGLLTAAADPAATRRRLDRVAEYEKPHAPHSSAGAAAIAYAALGDHTTALTIARRGGEEEGRSETLAQLAAYAACLPGDCVVIPFRGTSYETVPTARRLATLFVPPAPGPDIPRARSLLAEALTPDGWHHAVPVLAAIDPEAVLRVRDVVFAHLGLSDAGLRP